MTLAAPSTEIWVLGSLNLFTSSLLSFRENGMLFYLDDHALHVSLNLFLVMVTGGTIAEITTEGATGRRLRAMNTARCRRAGRAGGRGGEGRRRASQIVAKAELEEENMELAGCRGSGSARGARLAAAAVCPVGDVSGARRGHGAAVPSVRHCLASFLSVRC